MSFHLTISYRNEDEGTEPERCITVEVSRLHKVSEILHSVYSELRPQLTHDKANYGLYLKDKKKWLKQDQPVGRVLKERDRACLQFRLKTRSITIRFLDASSRSFVIDESLVVKEVVADVCRQMNLDHPEELSLVVAVDYAVDKHHPASTGGELKSPSGVFPMKKETHLDVGGGEGGSSPRNTRKKVRPSSASALFGRARSSSTTNSSQIKKQISRKHQMRIDTPWLDPNKTLREQDVDKTDELLLMYRFYYNMELDRNSMAVDMLFKQARARFLAREMTCSEDDIPRFTAILCQIAYGDYQSKEDTQEKLHKLKKTLLPVKLKSKPFVKEVAAYHVLLNGVSAQEGKCWFVKQWSSMKLFGSEFFSCSNWETKEKGLVGVSKNQIVFRHHNAKRENLIIDMDCLNTWESDSDSGVVSLVVTQDGVTKKLALHFPGFYSSIFIDCLQGNREISCEMSPAQLSVKEFQFDEELEMRYTRYATPTSIVHPDVQKVGAGSKSGRHKRSGSGSLTLKDVLYWNEAVESPLISKEEKDSWKTASWENPAFENLDQLMDERFSFLDFENTTKSSSSLTNIQRKDQSDSAVVTSSPESSPSTERLTLPSPNPHIKKHQPNRTQLPSPLVVNKLASSSSSAIMKQRLTYNDDPTTSSSENNSPELPSKIT